MNKELLEAMNVLEKENNISKETLLEAIENSLLTACKNHFGKADNVKVIIDHDTCDFSVYAEKEVVETVEDPILQISVADARMRDPKFEIGDIVQIPIDSHDFGRIATPERKERDSPENPRRGAGRPSSTSGYCMEKDDRYRHRAAVYRQEHQHRPWKGGRHPSGVGAGARRGVPANRDGSRSLSWK